MSAGARRRALLLLVPLLVASLPLRAPAAAPRSRCTVRHPSDARVAWTCRRLRAGESLERLFGDRWPDVARFNRMDRRHAGAGVSIKVPARLDDVRDFTPLPADLLEAAAEPRFVLIDQAEQFLGAYERGRLVLSVPVATGETANPTPTGTFRITAAQRWHPSSLYVIEGTEIPYPMTYALRFHVDRRGVAFWIHGRDMPGYPASHGCIGLADERMQRDHYGRPADPVLDDARRLYEWVLPPRVADDRLHALPDGPRVRIVGRAP